MTTETVPTITLCTYAREDAHHVHELLDTVPGWTVQPDEIVVVDSGIENVVHAGRLPKNARVLRGPEPLEAMQAKRLGIGAATTDLILSMDCDARIPDNWLEVVMPKALDTRVGMASSVWSEGSVDNMPSRYMRCFTSCEDLVGEVDLIVGLVWLMRREVWQKTGGYSGFTLSTHEDLLFSRRVTEYGYVLHKTDAVKGFQKRRLSLQSLVKRQWTFLDGMYRAGFASLPLAQRVDRMGEISLARAQLFLNNDDKDLCYVELLYLTYAHLRLILDHAPPGLDARLAVQAQVGVLLGQLAYWPRLASEMRSDLARLGFSHAGESGAVQAPDRCPRLTMLVRFLAQQNVLAWLDEHVPQLLALERAAKTDFSFYDRD